MRSTRRLPLLAIAACALAAIAPSLGSSSRPTVRVTESDFRIKGPKRLPAGDVRLEVENRGPDAHELIVVRLDGGALPLRRDGLTVDEDALEPRIAGALEPEEPGLHVLELRLRPGRYTLICNMAGHYLGGMNMKVVVR